MFSLNAELFRLILITSFGRGAKQPFRSAILRICCCVFGGISLGVVLGNSLTKADLAQGLPALLVASGITVITFALSGFVLQSAGSLTFQNSGNNVQRILHTLPLNLTARWFVLVLPLSIMGAVLLCLYIPLTIGIARSLDAPLLFCVLACLLGTFASIGFILLNYQDKAFLKISLFTIMVIEMVSLFDAAIKITSQLISNLYLSSILLLSVLVCTGFIQSYRNPIQLSGRSNRNFKKRNYLQIKTFVSLWFIAKILRNRRSLAALGFCMFVSLSLASGLYLRHQVNLAGVGWLIFGSVLACSFASDIRGLSRRYKTPEIVALKGVLFFMLSQLAASLLINTLLVLPLLTVVILGSPIAVSTLILYMSGIVVAGTVLGLLSSTLFVPQNGEIGSQVFTALVAFIGLFGFPKFLKLGELSLAVQAFSWLGIALVCFLAAIAIESMRRRNYIYARA